MKQFKINLTPSAKRVVAVVALLALMAFKTPPEPIKIYLIGDSTMSIKETKAYPETGWGMPFTYFFDSSAQVDNRAKNGRSTKTFISENRWQEVADNLKAGDYVFIQFGHNDESEAKAERYTTPAQYKINIERFISETKGKNAIPVLLTPVSRRKFNKDGKVMETHPVYSDLVRTIAHEQKVAFIDMDKKSQELYQQWGPENSKLLFLQLKPGEHPNYPNGVEDNTHFNELGARLIAQIVLANIRELKLGLSDHIVKKETK